MKKLILLLALTLMTNVATAQGPNGEPILARMKAKEGEQVRRVPITVNTPGKLPCYPCTGSMPQYFYIDALFIGNAYYGVTNPNTTQSVITEGYTYTGFEIYLNETGGAPVASFSTPIGVDIHWSRTLAPGEIYWGWADTQNNFFGSGTYIDPGQVFQNPQKFLQPKITFWLEPLVWGGYTGGTGHVVHTPNVSTQEVFEFQLYIQ